MNNASRLEFLKTVLVFVTLGTGCQMAPAAGAGGVPVFEPGGAWKYQLHSTVLLNEINENNQNAKDVGFFVSGELLIQSIWGSPDYDRLLRFELSSPKLYIRSRKAPSFDGFVGHSSKLDGYPTRPFFVLWSGGKVQKVLLLRDEPLSLANVKKGIASLFQFQLLDQELNETDSSGHCIVRYTSTSPTTFTKTKLECDNLDLPAIKNPQVILNTRIRSNRMTEYQFDSSNKYPKEINAEEVHEMFLNAKEDVGNKVHSQLRLTLLETSSVETQTGKSFEEVAAKLGNVFTQESLLTEREPVNAEEVKAFPNAVSDYRENLKYHLLGTLAPAKVFVRLVSIARKSNREEIFKTLNSKKNSKILNQLYDILGYVQTSDAHQAVMKKLHFDVAAQEENSERYLWASSMSSQPNPEIIKDLLERFRNPNLPEKVKETLLLTIASMGHHLRNLPDQPQNFKVHHNVRKVIVNGLDAVQGEERYLFLRALKNFKSEDTIPILLDVIKKGSSKEGVLAWKALKALKKNSRSDQVLKTAFKTFFQLDKKHDSSSRTLAADILLEGNPSEEVLKNLIYFLTSQDKAFEVKQYLIQCLKMKSEIDVNFKKKVWDIIHNDCKLNNYATLGQRGLSTALTRNFLSGSSSNGSLLTIQEMHGGIVKRGIVNVVMEKDGVSEDIFSLGIFSGGLSSFLSSDSNDEEESAMAGMELTVLDTQIRPFVFFTGQGELMGHVWSGTASERTTAFQALAMLQDHSEHLRLGSGYVVELDVKGAASFDLSGRVEFSLWNRNAESFVEKSAGIVVLGLLKLDTAFVRSQVEFSVSIEPKLTLQTNINFASNVNLCMRVAQPDSTFRHNVFKIERIPGSKHRLRKVKYKTSIIPGRTYSLNKKNNEMCSAIFKS